MLWKIELNKYVNCKSYKQCYIFFLDTNKAAAYICYRLKQYESAAYYLSEAHGGGVRSKLSLIMNPE